MRRPAELWVREVRLQPSRRVWRVLLYLHVCVDQVHRLRLVVAEQTHGRHRVGSPVRPIAVDEADGQIGSDPVPRQT